MKTFKEKLDKNEFYKPAYSVVREIIKDPNNCRNGFFKTIYNDIDTGVSSYFHYKKAVVQLLNS